MSENRLCVISRAGWAWPGAGPGAGSERLRGGGGGAGGRGALAQRRQRAAREPAHGDIRLSKELAKTADTDTLA